MKKTQKKEERQKEKEKKDKGFVPEVSAPKTEAEDSKEIVSVVTGACGFIGSHMVEVLKEAGHKVVASDLPEAFEGKDELGKARYPELVKKLASQIFPADLTNKNSLKGIARGADYIFHIAAILDYSVSWEKLYNVNVVGTRNLFEVVAEENPDIKRVVVWSTNGIYGFPEPGGIEVDENSAVKPVSKYALSKWFQERVAYEYFEKGIKVSVIKPTAVYGPRCVYGLLDMIKAINNLPVVFCPKNFTFRIPFVHVRDVCRSALFVAQRKESEGEDYIVDDDSGISYIDFMKYAAKEFVKPFITLPSTPLQSFRRAFLMASRIETILASIARRRPKLEYELLLFTGYDFKYSNKKLKSLGFELQYPSILDGFSESINWYKEAKLL